MMLTLEACKALATLGFPQGKPPADAYDFWKQADGRWAVQRHAIWIPGPHLWYACPDSHDALDWLAAKCGGEWEKQIEMPVSDYRLWFPATHACAIEVGLTPSELICAVAEKAEA